MLRERLTRLSPWVLITLTGCATLAAVDFWRDQGPTAVPLVRSTLPNFIAVPTLAFGFLMVRFPERQPYTPSLGDTQRRWFWSLWAGAVAVIVIWEFMQRASSLVFDPLDLVATAAGAVGAAVLFLGLQRTAFLPDA